MKTCIPIHLSILCFAMSVSFAETAPTNQPSASPAAAATASPTAPAATQAQFDKMTGALKDRDFPAFAADGNEAFLVLANQENFSGACDLITDRLKGGSQITYLGSLNKEGYVVSYWKATFTDGGDDMLLTMSLKDGKVGGFTIQ